MHMLKVSKRRTDYCLSLAFQKYEACTYNLIDHLYIDCAYLLKPHCPKEVALELGIFAAA
jgi:hypothetical protein